jgi:putative flippase GtrA
MQALKSILKSKWMKPLGFAIVGALGTVVSTAVLYFCTEFFHIYYLLSFLVSTEISIIYNFALNDTFTFWDEEYDISVWRRLINYHLVSATGVVITAALLFVLTEFVKIYYVYSNVIAIIIVFFFNFAVNRIFTWKTKK